MSDDQRPENLNSGNRVDKINVDGQMLSAEEILARARKRVQNKQSPSHSGGVAPQSHQKTVMSNADIALLKQKNDQARKKIIQKKPSLTVAETSNTQSQPVTPSDTAAVSDNQATLVKGSAWLSVGNMVSRILGALYILPWMAMLGVYGNRANGLFTQGYNVYAVFLAIATFGIPAAISKIVAELAAKHDIYRSRQLTRQSIWLGIGLGILFGAILYIAAPWLSNGNANVIPVLHSLAPAVAIFPLMSMIRGIFQGHQLMSVSAMSQVIEQIARVAYMLITAVVILKSNPTNWTGVVVQSTFAAFIGAIFSMLVLIWGWARYRHILVQPIENAQPTHHAPTFGLVLNILRESWPFIIIGSAITLFQLVDQYSFFDIMNHFFANSNTELLNQFALFSANPNKLIMIIVPFSTSIAATALPMLSGSKATLTHADIQTQLKQVMKLFALIMLPSALGMYAVAGPLYKMFYPIGASNQDGIYLLQYSTILAIAFSLFMLLSFVLQALSEVSIVMKAFIAGFVIKIVLQIPLIRFFEGMGALMASVIGMVVAIAYMLDFLKSMYGVSFSTIGRELWRMFVASAMMAVIARLIVFFFSNFVFPMDTKLSVTITTFVAVFIGGAILIMAYIRIGVADDLLGSKMRFVPKILRPKR